MNWRAHCFSGISVFSTCTCRMSQQKLSPHESMWMNERFSRHFGCSYWRSTLLLHTRYFSLWIPDMEGFISHSFFRIGTVP